ncbi:uncharacterized protein LOC144867312 [Branchiostoma floridae x Branchiostoma japonicum]
MQNMATVRTVVFCGILLPLCCYVHGENVQGFEGGTVLLSLASFPEFDETKKLELTIVDSDGTEQTVLDWPAGFVVDMANVSEQFRGRMSLISSGEPGQHQGPAAVRITDLRPSDMVTGGYFQFRQPGSDPGPRMELRVFAITVSASPNPASIGQKVAITCSVDGGSPDSFTWTHEDTGQTIQGTQNLQGSTYTAEFMATPDSAGSYVCSVSGAIGQGRKNMHLQVGGAMVTTVTTPTSAAMTTIVTTPSLGAMATASTSRTPAPTEEKFSTIKLDRTLGLEPVLQSDSPGESEGLNTEAIIACVLGGVIFIIVIAAVVAVVWFRKRRKRETEEENVGNGDIRRPQEGMYLPQLNGHAAGTRTPIAPCHLALPVQTSSLCSSYEEEQNNINSTRPLLAKQRPKLQQIPDLGSHTPARSAATQTPVDSPTDDMFYLNEVTSRNDEVTSPQATEDNTDPKAASSARPFHRNKKAEQESSPAKHRDDHRKGAKRVSTPTSANSLPDQIIINNEATSPQAPDDNTDPKEASSGRPNPRGTGTSSPAINTQRFSDARVSVSLDGSTATEPHSLRSQPRQLNSRTCPQLEDMISYSTGTEPTQSGVSTVPTKSPSSGQNKKLHHPNKAASSREGTQPNDGFRSSLETMMEDTIAEDGGGGQVSNREGLRVDASELRAMSLEGNEVATTIDQMIRKELVDVGNLNIPYRKFSQLCLQLYNTQRNWKVLADRLGLTSGDILLIDSCSAQHNLPAAEIVLRHWQRTSRRDRTTSTPCTLHNLRTILQDMGRADLVSMLNK